MTDISALEVVIKVSLLIGVAVLVRKFVTNSQPATRHLILFAALGGALLIPIAAPFLKSQTNFALPQELAPQVSTASNSTSQIGSNLAPAKPLAINRNAEMPWGTVVTLLWGLGVGTVLIRYAVGLAALRRIQLRRSVAFESADFPLKPDWLSANLTIHQPWQLRVSTDPHLKTAMTWGLRHPIILLPAEASTWTSQRMEMILLHEFAHLRRKDYVSQMLAEFACAIYWFNPIVWLSARAMREDAELAADEAVLSAGVRPSDYASELLDIAAALGSRNRMPNRVGISNMTNSKIESRLNAILSPNAQHRGSTLVQALSTVLLSGLAIAAIASIKVKQEPSNATELKTQAMIRLKHVELATLMYAQDFDEQYPYVTSTKEAQRVTMPYIKNRSEFNSPRTGAEFRYNLNLAGVGQNTVEAPAESILWYEVTPKGIDPVAGYADGHVKVVLPEGREAFQKALKKTFSRVKGAKPVRGIGN